MLLDLRWETLQNELLTVRKLDKHAVPIILTTKDTLVMPFIFAYRHIETVFPRKGESPQTEQLKLCGQIYRHIGKELVL